MENGQIGVIGYVQYLADKGPIAENVHVRIQHQVTEVKCVKVEK